MILWGGGGPVHRKMFSSLLGLYPGDASDDSKLWQSKMSLVSARWSPRAKSPRCASLPDHFVFSRALVPLHGRLPLLSSDFPWSPDVSSWDKISDPHGGPPLKSCIFPCFSLCHPSSSPIALAYLCVTVLCIVIGPLQSRICNLFILNIQHMIYGPDYRRWSKCIEWVSRRMYKRLNESVDGWVDKFVSRWVGE